MESFERTTNSIRKRSSPCSSAESRIILCSLCIILPVPRLFHVCANIAPVLPNTVSNHPRGWFDANKAQVLVNHRHERSNRFPCFFIFQFARASRFHARLVCFPFVTRSRIVSFVLPLARGVSLTIFRLKSLQSPCEKSIL